MPETGAAISEWWAAAGEASAAESAAGAAAAGEGAAVAGGALAGEGVLSAADAGIKSGVTAADAMGGTNLAASAPASAEGIVPGSGPAATSLAEAPAPTATHTAAQDLIAGPAETGTGAPSGLNPGQYVDPGTGSVVTPGPGTGAGDVASKGMLSSAMDWVNAKPINTLIAGQAIGGVAKGAFEERAAEKKRKAAEDLASLPARQKMGNPSVGGGGVNLNLSPGGRILTRPDGTKVFVPGSGLINGSMNGVRG